MGHLAGICRAHHFCMRRCTRHCRNHKLVLHAESRRRGGARTISSIKYRQRYRRYNTLEDGRSVVIKVHQPERSRQFLAEIVRIRSYLSVRGGIATKVLAGPLPLGRGLAIVQAFADIGAKADAHRPEIRSALAGGLHTSVQMCAPLAETTSLGPGVLASAARPFGRHRTASYLTLPPRPEAPSGLTRHSRRQSWACLSGEGQCRCAVAL